MPFVLVLFAPLMVWYWTPDAWHPTLAIAAVIISVVSAILYTRFVRRWHAKEAATSAARDEYRWLPTWDAKLYERHFESFLRFRGWRILSSSAFAPGPGRLTVVVEKYRCRLALLCVEPTQDAAVSDLSHVESLGREVRATHAALVSRSTSAPPDLQGDAGCNVWQIRYGDLPRLDELFRVDV
jgi:hypothetical protein